MTWLDFALWENLELLDYLAKGKLDYIHPEFAGYRQRFRAIPEFASIWADDNKSMKYPFNGDSARFGAKQA